jgi:hypothetical protein
VAVYKTSNSGLLTRREYTSFLAGNEKFIPSFAVGAYDSIATSIGTGANDEITFTSIPSTYTHLQIRGIANAGGTANNMNVRLNGDTSSVYVRHRLLGDGSTASAVSSTGQSQIVFLANSGLPTAANTYAVFIIDILDYANTNKNKTVTILSGQDSNGSGNLDFTSGLWPNTSAITSVTVRLNGGAYTVPSQVALYGIKGV